MRPDVFPLGRPTVFMFSAVQVETSGTALPFLGCQTHFFQYPDENHRKYLDDLDGEFDELTSERVR